MDRALAPTAVLARFASELGFAAIPPAVIDRAEDLFLDWAASCLAGKGAPPVVALERFSRAMGPANGAAEVLVSRRRTTAYFAAMINAAASHVVEQDDVHNGSVFHPGTVVFPPALAVAQTIGASGQELLAAVVAGYEVGIRVGEFLGRSHYRVFHTTGTAGTLAAAATVGRLLRLTPEVMQHALGSAGTQAAGLWEFLRDAADSKQLHTAKAAADGLLAAYLARDGFTGARRILEGPQGMAAGMSTDADPARLTAGLGTRWALAETSFKFHASCRHTHPAADALLAVVTRERLAPRDILRVIAHVHQGALDVLGPVVDPVTVHQAKFSMGTVLALIARFERAGLTEFASAFRDPETVALRERVSMSFDAEVDAAYPARWIGKVEVETADGRVLRGRVDEPKGDPGNTLSRAEILAKAQALAAYGEAATATEIDRLAEYAFGLHQVERIGALVDGATSAATPDLATATATATAMES
ncbi:MAG: MmgE/PrpD family protein [Casimicrobiaceae bacterium]